MSQPSYQLLRTSPVDRFRASDRPRRVGAGAVLLLCKRVARNVGYAADKAVAVLALLVLSPLFAANAISIRARSGGPVLVAQTRVGRRGRLIRMLSFRADTTAEAAGGASPGPVHRWLDALPRLINVLRGEMSIVGPRAPRPEELARLLRGRPGVISVGRRLPSPKTTAVRSATRQPARSTS